MKVDRNKFAENFRVVYKRTFKTNTRAVPPHSGIHIFGKFVKRNMVSRIKKASLEEPEFGPETLNIIRRKI